MKSSNTSHDSGIVITGHILFVGDVHGKSQELLQRATELVDRFSSLNDGQPRNLILLGDVGMGLYERVTTQMQDAFEILAERGWNVYLIRGNHDDPHYWHGCGGAVTLLQDNKLITINGKRVFVSGGGVSLDRSLRRLGVDYWREESLFVPNHIPREVGKVDAVLSHVGPTPPDLSTTFVERWKLRDRSLDSDLEMERIQLERLASLRPDYWIYGHFHHNLCFDYKYSRCYALDELFFMDGGGLFPIQTTDTDEQTTIETSWYFDRSKTEVQERVQRPDGHVDIYVPFMGLYEALDDLVENQAFAAEKEHIQEEEENVASIVGKFNLASFCNVCVHKFAELFDLKTLAFAYLISPKDYSMASDALCCTISRDEFWNVYKNMSDEQRQIYDKLVKQVCTPSPGYTPYQFFDPTVPSKFQFSSSDDIPEESPAVTELLMTTLAASEAGDFQLDGTYNPYAFWMEHLDPCYVNENLDVEVQYNTPDEASSQDKNGTGI